MRRADLDGAADDLRSWRLHTGAGLQVAASSPRAEVGTVVALRLGVGPLSVTAPCRVVEVWDEPDRRGFAYSTLPGHPERGAEWFVLERAGDGRLILTITAVSAPGSALARLGGPLTDLVQHRITRRYLRALDRRS